MTVAPEQAFPDNVGLDINIKNSQNDNPVPGAVVSVSIDDEILTNGTLVNGQGGAFIPVYRNGTYSLNIEAEGFIPNNITMTVQCASAGCQNRRLVALSPLLEVGETRIIMTWEKEKPEDIDLHVMAVKISDNSTCRTHYNRKEGCERIRLDNDNLQGGHSGPETITLLDNSVNKDYVYLIGIEEYHKYETDGIHFLSSGARVLVTNGVKDDSYQMRATTFRRNFE